MSGFLLAPRIPRAAPFLSAAATAAVLVTAAPFAQAFCRSTTCAGDCPRDEKGCKTKGAQLFWPNVCVGYSLQKDGTVNLPFVQVRKVVQASFTAWSDLDCGDGKLASIAFSPLDDAACHRSEYSEDSPNSNIVLFQDTRWRYKGVDNTLAKTTVTFDTETGLIFDADIEVNHAYNHFTVSNQNVEYDLLSVLTHEVGHFIGMDHSEDFDATMNASYSAGSTELRTLEADDVAGACAIYPPNREGKCDPTPRNGFGYNCAPDAENKDGGGEEGGCSVAGTERAAGGAFGWLLAGAGLLGLGTARRKRTRTRRRS